MDALRMQMQLADNRLLAALTSQDQTRIRPQMRAVDLKRKQIISLSGELMGNVYFPTSAIFSLVSVMADGASTEVGMVGNEGMTGLPAVLGTGSEPFEMVVHVAGSAWRMSARTLADEARRSVPLMDLVLRYSQVFSAQVGQATACRGRHSLRQRMAKWLLMIRDGTQTDQFRMSQELLAQMLGVGRPRACLTAKSLRDDGLIGYHREFVTVTDSPGLEAAACECYRVLRSEYDRLLA